MKTFIISIFLLSILCSKIAKSISGNIINHEILCSLKDTTIYPLITYTSIDLQSFQNLPVDTFLAHLPAGYILSPLLPQDNLKTRTQICAVYGNHIEFYIIVRDFKYMNPYSLTGDWDVNLFKREKIARIELYQNGDCIKGCD